MEQRSNDRRIEADSKKNTFVERLEELDFVTDVQLNDGNWNADYYMMGMANGLLLAQAIMVGSDFKPLERPRYWTPRKENRDHLRTRNTQSTPS